MPFMSIPKVRHLARRKPCVTTRRRGSGHAPLLLLSPKLVRWNGRSTSLLPYVEISDNQLKQCEDTSVLKCPRALGELDGVGTGLDLRIPAGYGLGLQKLLNAPNAALASAT